MIFWICIALTCIAGAGLAVLLAGFNSSLDDYERPLVRGLESKE